MGGWRDKNRGRHFNFCPDVRGAKKGDSLMAGGWGERPWGGRGHTHLTKVKGVFNGLTCIFFVFGTARPDNLVPRWMTAHD